jgi:septal ring factor EnvC (AmiA/AmiB activator)
MGRLTQGAVLLAIGALIIAIVYWEPQSLTQWADYARMRQWILLGAFILCGAGLALFTYAIGFATAEEKYAPRISSLTARIEVKRRELRDLSQELEWERKELSAARRRVAIAKNKLAVKRRQLAVVSGKLGDKEKRLKKIRKVAGA